MISTQIPVNHSDGNKSMLTKNKDHLEFSFLPFSDRRHGNEEQLTASLASWFIDPFCVESLFPVLAARGKRGHKRIARKGRLRTKTLFCAFCLRNDADSVCCSRPKLSFIGSVPFLRSLPLLPHLFFIVLLFASFASALVA